MCYNTHYFVKEACYVLIVVTTELASTLWEWLKHPTLNQMSALLTRVQHINVFAANSYIKPSFMLLQRQSKSHWCKFLIDNSICNVCQALQGQDVQYCVCVGGCDRERVFRWIIFHRIFSRSPAELFCLAAKLPPFPTVQTNVDW